MAHAIASQSSTWSLFDRMAALRTQFSQAAEKRRMFRTTINELECLTDRDLSDLGLTRSMIPTVARQAAGLE